MQDMLSLICSSLLMPESTVSTPSSPAANLSAHEAAEESGSAPLSTSSTVFGGFASIPPFTGSITITGFPCFLATS